MSLNAAGAVAALGAVGVAVARANRTLEDRQIPLLGVTAAFVFAAQMLNFPIVGGTSGHFLGAVLTAILLGPLNACLVMAVVLAIQCLLFCDGGLTALGTNIVNMGVIGGIVCGSLYAGLARLLPRTRASVLGAAAVAAWTSVVLGSAAVALELAGSGTSPLRVVLPALVGVHALIGVGEAIITCIVLSVIVQIRPDLIKSWTEKTLGAPGVATPGGPEVAAPATAPAQGLAGEADQ